ncbi:GGDEF domain-containing phosphodiesterase [Methylotenera mobilis]|uniref:Diguanylate cyclase/phosphodiesterase n=1 Tax=Methylotenera mobilis (strain JLW8 / ATCC BAA-1282 / DSM 17540) TaxID=583345 RepID=C6WWG6_METML|nr:GGDEF domain-containing phosphodiesterase [Methylotenera mobilis]ACT48265.1 diguanylate cyclase/phosphodiesterase [Methylotenera mobilis JLW8]
MMKIQEEIYSLIDHEFTLNTSPNELLTIMQAYQLSPKDLAGPYHYNPQLAAANPDTTPNNMLQVLQDWPQQLNWSQLNQAIDELLHHWLLDYKAGGDLGHALMLTQCIQLQTATHTDSALSLYNPQFHLVLTHLLSLATNQFDQYRYNYSKSFDLTTGLPNHQLMHKLIKKAEAENINLGLLLLNLNINPDKERKISTDQPTLELAAVDLIQQHLSKDTRLFHISPNEFAIIIEDLHFPAQLNLIASELIHAFESSLPLVNNSLIVKPYFGGVTTFKHTSKAHSLYECAKLALHHAMINHYQIEMYDQHITSVFSSTHSLEEAIIEALQNNELEVYLQPIVSLPKHELGHATCVSAEMLLRWHNEEWVGISPMRLIDTIYKKGFGKIFIRWLINTACQRIAEVIATNQNDFALTVNLSSPDLLDADLPELIAQSIALWDIPAKSLVIEITESDLLLDEKKAMSVINRISQLGCSFALDDFGTGYSSMTRLRNMPISLVKIDQSFVKQIDKSTQDREIVLSIIQLAHSLGKTVVAEGVEDLSCLNILTEMQCDKIQGYYYSKSMSLNDFNVWLANFQNQYTPLTHKHE